MSQPEPELAVDQRDLPPLTHLKALAGLGVGLALAFFAAMKLFL